MRRPAPLLASAALLVGAALCTASVARSANYAQPADAVPRELAGADAQAVVAHCMGCHSLDYLTTQPRGKGAQFWRDAVRKMITVYGAPITPAQAEPLSAVLAAKLG